MVNINDELFQEEARVAGIFPLGMMGDPENSPDWLGELHDHAYVPEHPLFKQLPELAPLAGCTDVKNWSDALLYQKRCGFIVKYEVCVRHYQPNGTTFISGWWMYQSGYHYFETFDEIGPAVLKLAREQHEAERAKAGAA